MAARRLRRAQPGGRILRGIPEERLVSGFPASQSVIDDPVVDNPLSPMRVRTRKQAGVPALLTEPERPA